MWKARVNGYEEATKLFQQWDEDDPKWKSYQPLAKKMVSDSNAVALEKGLECCLAFAENCKTAPKTGGEVGFHLCRTQRTFIVIVPHRSLRELSVKRWRHRKPRQKSLQLRFMETFSVPRSLHKCFFFS